MKKAVEMLEFENEYAKRGYKAICGMDEVGRGPLAGPVVVCALVMPLDGDKLIDGVDDSKKLSEKRREALFDKITAAATALSVVRVEPREIDEINILEATKKAMKKAVDEIKDKADIVFVDAVKLDLPLSTLAIIKGDAKSYNIAAASIVAKVYRDRLMKEYAEQYPQYDFASNKGYGTAKHIAALRQYGATPIHRRSFIGHFVNEHEKDGD